MPHNEHKRLAKRLLPRFDPTWLGDPTSTAAVLPPVATTVNAVPTTSASQPAVQTTPAVVPAQTTTAPAVTLATSTSAVVSTTAQLTTSSPVASSTELVTSSTALTTSTSSTPVVSVAEQTTARPTTSAARVTTPSVTRNVATFTNSQGGVVYSTMTISASASATPSETAAPVSGNVGTIVGAVAGSLVGVVCLIAFVSWLIRQHNKRKDGNHDDFDRQSYLRSSMMIPDDPAASRPVIGTQAALALARNNTVGSRPPSMLERKPTYLMANGQPSPSFTPGQVVSFDPGQVMSAPHTGDGSYPSPMAFTAYTPPAQHHQSELSRRPSGAQLLTRQPTNGGMYDGAPYAQTPSPGGYGSDYQAHSPDNYLHGGYTYPMHPGMPGPERGMVQSVTPYQAQQYAEITRALEGPDFATTESFHPIPPVGAPVGQAVSDENASTFSRSSGHGDKASPNPFADGAQRVDSTPPSLPPVESLSRTGTPIDPNPQHAHWSYDGKGQAEGHRLSVAGTPAPVAQTPAMPAAAYTRQERAVVVGNGEELKDKRPVSYVDTDDAYGGM